MDAKDVKYVITTEINGEEYTSTPFSIIDVSRNEYIMFMDGCYAYDPTDFDFRTCNLKIYEGD